MPERKRRLVAYLRVSTIEQKAYGFGLDVQRKAIRDAARALDARVVVWSLTRVCPVRCPPRSDPTWQRRWT